MTYLFRIHYLKTKQNKTNQTIDNAVISSPIVTQSDFSKIVKIYTPWVNLNTCIESFCDYIKDFE